MILKPKRVLFIKWGISFFAIASSILFVVLGFFFFQNEKSRLKVEQDNDFTTISRLKTDQIIQWQKERTGDAVLFSHLPYFISLVDQWLSGKKSDNIKQNIKDRLSLFQNYNEYKNVFISTVKGEVLFSLQPAAKHFDSFVSEKIMESVKLRKIIYTDLYYNKEENKIYYDIIAPLVNVKDQVIAVLVLRIDPSKYLYPLIQSWPIQSKTTETILVRKENDSIVFLSGLRFLSNAAFRFKLSMTQRDHPAVLAVLGNKGLWNGTDYRGVDVIAYLNSVPGTNWFMVAKVDKNELYRDLYRENVLLVIVIFSFILTIIGGLISLYNYRQRSIYRELWKSSEEFAITLHSIGDAVISTDNSGIVMYMNTVAEQLTGWNMAEANGKPIAEVFKIINEKTREPVENPVKKVIHGGTVIGLANHTLLISKNDREISIEDSGSPIKNKSGEIIGVVLVFKDQTQAKEAQIKLANSEVRYRCLFEAAKDGILILDAETGMIVDVNPFLIEMLGYSKEQFIEKAIWEIGFFKDIVASKDNFLELQLNEYIRYADMPLETAYGRKINVEFISNVYQVNSHKVIQCNIRDTTDRTMEENRIKLSSQILNLLNTTTPFNETIDLIISHIQVAFGFDAVGIRVRNGDDYPYFSQNGFDADFLKTENTLIERTKEGGVCMDKNGKPNLECTCGLVISGIIDSTNPLFTEGGSFWTNDSPVLLGLTADQEPRHNPRNRCIHDGYQSVALIPIRHNAKIVGLLQLNDRKKDCFTPTTIKFFESIGEMIGVALIRKQGEDAIKQEHTLLFNLTEQVPGVVYQYRLFPDGRSCFPYSSSGMFEIYEVTSDEVHEDATPVFGRIHPDDLQRVSELIFESARTLQHFFCEFRVVLPSQGLRWRYSDAVPQRLDDGSTLWHGIIYDITERKYTEKALTESEKLYRNLVESSLDGVYKSTHGGKFIEINTAMVSMLGYESKEELMAIDIKTQLYFIATDRESLIQQELLEEIGVYRLRKKDGSELWVEDHAWYDFDGNGDILYHEGILRDITDRKFAEDNLRLLNETLEVRIAERTQQLEDLNKKLAFHVDELEQFAYVSNHDLNEPLRTLTQFTQLLQDEYSGKLDEDGNKYIEFIYNSGLRMKELVTGLFNYTLLGKDRKKTAIDCKKIVNSVLSDLDHSIKGSNAKVTVQELPTIYGYETELRLLFQNLIANAIKFQKNDVSPEIVISSVNSEKEWLFSVKDNGIGIEPKHKDKIFIIFQRLHKRNEFTGTGIGLAHCKKVVELHGGRIWVESDLGAGSTFKFTIPKS